MKKNEVTDASEHEESAVSEKPTESTPAAIQELEAPTASDSPPAPVKLAWKARLRRLVRDKRFLVGAGVVTVALVLVFAVPVTRYKILSVFIKQTISVKLTDTKTGRGISGATVRAANHTAVSDKDGVALLTKMPLGNQQIMVTKKYFKDLSGTVLVTPGASKSSFAFKLQATGRQVPISVINKITKQPLADVLIRTGDADARTDKDGKAIIVLPAEAEKVEATLSGDGLNDATVSIRIVETESTDNTFSLVPSGKVYFLSKQSGKIDVVKTNLDGSDRQVVLAGTGKEEDRGTVLLASRDWKYLALIARRETEKTSLSLIETASDKVRTIEDASDVFIQPHGWVGHSFVYGIDKLKPSVWEPKRTAIKSFAAPAGTITRLDENMASGSSWQDYANESFRDVILLDDEVVYQAQWDGSNTADKKIALRSISPDGKNKKVIKEWPATESVSARLYEPEEIAVRHLAGTQATSYEYEDGALKQVATVSSEEFYKSYPTYLQSPDGDRTFWSDARDGKQVLFVGDKAGKNEKVIAELSELTPYGWYSDDYLLVSKKGSELFIMPRSGVKEESALLKISNYHKPERSFAGYGGGYGGF